MNFRQADTYQDHAEDVRAAFRRYAIAVQQNNVRARLKAEYSLKLLGEWPQVYGNGRFVKTVSIHPGRKSERNRKDARESDRKVRVGKVETPCEAGQTLNIW